MITINFRIKEAAKDEIEFGFDFENLKETDIELKIAKMADELLKQFTELVIKLLDYKEDEPIILGMTLDTEGNLILSDKEL